MRLIDADKLIEAFKDYPFGDSITLQGAIDVIDGFADTNRDHEMYEKKKLETFIAVRDILKKSGNTLAHNMCYRTPWGFYGKHSVEECVKILLDKCTVTNQNCNEEYSDEIFLMGKNINYCPNCGAKMYGGNEND